MIATRLLDGLLDRSLVLGYTKIGPAVRRAWWPADPEPGCLEGRHVVVTGATSGIGTAIAAGLGALGATVHVLGRNPDKVDQTLRALVTRGGTYEGEVCDVGDLDAVRAWCDDFSSRVDGLHGLVHNAGVLTQEREESKQGHESGLAVHVLGPHLMTKRLRPLLRADAGSVVVMSSGGMYSAGLRHTIDEIEYREAPYDGVRAYARTKRMQVELVELWAQRWREELGGDADAAVRVASTHPGWAATPGVTDALPGFDKVMGPLLRTAEGGADTTVWLVAQRPRPRSGSHFWHDRGQRPTTWPVQRPADEQGRGRLWTFVESATADPS